MLGESAVTAADVSRYFDSYADAIKKIGAGAGNVADIFSAPSISVKLSALSPRYSYTLYDRAMRELVPRVLELCKEARAAGIVLTIDAEECHRLELSLNILQRVYRDASMADYEGLGLAVQAYQRRASDVVDFLANMADEGGRRIPLRLVKGAYWDTEIKVAQESGLESYPVFTRKAHTDVSYLACARMILNAGSRLYPQYATHNPIRSPAFCTLPGLAGILSFNACTEWAKSSTQKLSIRTNTAEPAVSTDRSAATKTCCRIWCDACWRMARIPPSSTRYSMRGSRSKTSSRTLSR